MKTNKYILLFLSFALVFVSCDEELLVNESYDGPTVLSLERSAQTIGVCEPTQSITVQSSSVASTDRTFSLVVDGASTADPSEYTLTPSVTIPAGEYSGSTNITIDFGAIPDDTSRTLILDLVTPEGTSDYRTNHSVNFSSACVLNEVDLNMTFDNFPEEAAFILSDGTGAIVDASFDSTGAIGFGVFADENSISRTYCLPDGDYSITFFDSFGDGNTAGTGSYGMKIKACDGDSDAFEPLSSSSFGAPGSVLGSDPVTIEFSLP